MSLYKKKYRYFGKAVVIGNFYTGKMLLCICEPWSLYEHLKVSIPIKLSSANTLKEFQPYISATIQRFGIEQHDEHEIYKLRTIMLFIFFLYFNLAFVLILQLLTE